MYLKKRKAQIHSANNEITQPKSWKGRVLVRNPTVKKAQASTKKVVWFSSAPAEDLALYAVELTGKIRCQEALRARQCLNFELHYKLHHPFPPTVKLLVFAALYKCDTGEEVKEGVINNYAYVHCSTCYGVAVFQKLYLDTRSQVPHFLEFTLWVERENASNPVDCYGRETFYPVVGNNIFRTSSFIPHGPLSSKNSQTSTDEVSSTASENKIELIKMVPSTGCAGDTTYITFQWLSSRDLNGEIFVVWNDEIIHVPYYSKGGNERILILEKIPLSQVATVPVYLQEKPPQDSRASGVRSNTLFFHYDRLTTTSEMDSQPAFFASNAGNDASSEPTMCLKRPYSFHSPDSEFRPYDIAEANTEYPDPSYDVATEASLHSLSNNANSGHHQQQQHDSQRQHSGHSHGHSSHHHSHGHSHRRHHDQQRNQKNRFITNSTNTANDSNDANVNPTHSVYPNLNNMNINNTNLNHMNINHLMNMNVSFNGTSNNNSNTINMSIGNNNNNHNNNVSNTNNTDLGMQQVNTQQHGTTPRMIVDYLTVPNPNTHPNLFTSNILSNWSSEGLEGGSATITESLSFNDSLDHFGSEWVPSMEVIEDLFDCDADYL